MTGQQQNLFETEPAPWELDDAEHRLVATVVPCEGPDGEFDYLAPGQLAERLVAGMRVQVPLGRGNRQVIGYCVHVGEKAVTTRRLKCISKLIDQRPLLSAAMLALTRRMADYYLCSFAQVLKTVVPGGVRSQAGTKLVTLLSAAAGAADQLTGGKLPDKQAQVLRRLVSTGETWTPAELAKACDCTTGPITALRKKGLILARQERVSNFSADTSPPERESILRLSDQQAAALRAIQAAIEGRTQKTLLMHGVTGSGKTEVYMQAISEVIGYGRQSIILVPEISLTPQTVGRFRRRFDHVAVLHSHMSDAQRAWYWEQIASGRIQVVVGARSAIFAPTPHLGLIIIDEEHEATFKQDQTPRYHARDVALWRAEAEQVPLVLGSATPSLESWHHAGSGRYELLSLPQRVLGRPLPDVRTIDMREESHSKASRGAISRQLHQAISAALKEGGQIILLLNRRGFATHIQCPACGVVVQCPDCDIALTHHIQSEKALCHYCEYEVPTPTACPECRSPGIRLSGRGTQKLEGEVRRRFPGYTVLRMDTDSMRKPGSHEKAFSEFRSGSIDILLGTQMIAKGLDFPNVTLVGVINADTALHLPDFRAAERTFQLVTQVAGRTGRGEKGGRVLVQTLSPEHEAIQAAVRHDYHRFARFELPIREACGYPPFTQMIRTVIRGPQQEPTRHFAVHLADCLQKASDAQQVGARVLGPAPAPLPKLRGNYRFQIQLQAAHGDALRQMVGEVVAQVQAPQDVQWIVDVDPVDMM